MRVVLSGYYGFDNAGDEALLTAITRSLLSSSAGELECVVLSGNPSRTEAIHGVRAVGRMHPLVLLRELLRADLLISGGGSLLQDVTGWRSIPYYLGVVALAKLLGKPVAFYAQGVGPIRGALGKYLTRMIANQVNLITLRDQDSADLLRELGVQDPPMKVTADPVFSMQPPVLDPAFAQSYLKEIGFSPEQPPIGLSLRRWKAFSAEDWAIFCDALQAAGLPVLLIPFQTPEDLVWCRQVSDLARSKPPVADRPMTFIELISLVAAVPLLIGMRLHSLIFAACAGTPFEGLAYDPKVESFLGSFRRVPLAVPGFFDPVQATAQVLESFADRENTRTEIQMIAQEMKERSDETARLVLSLLQ